MIKKIISVVLSAIITAGVCGCASSGVAENSGSTSNPKIASTSVAICQILDKLEYDNVVAVPETATENQQLKRISTHPFSSTNASAW